MTISSTACNQHKQSGPRQQWRGPYSWKEYSMRKLLFRRKKAVEQINRMIWEEHVENQFEESQVMRSYSAGIIDGLGLALTVLSRTPAEESRSFPLSISFYEEEDESCTIAKKQQIVEDMRERVFDLQQSNKLSLFYEEVD